MKSYLLAALVLVIICHAALAQPSFEWVTQIGGSNDESAQSTTVDNNGNVYTTGQFRGTLEVNPGSGNQILTTIGMHDIFITKFDASGNFVWAKQIGNEFSEASYSITTDSNGNVYTTGFFQGTVDFDPNAGVVNLTSVGSLDIFVQKLDASGNLIWAKRFGGTGHDEGRSISFDNNTNIYLTGRFQGTVDFDPGPGIFELTSGGSFDIFVVKLDLTGNFVWANRTGGIGDDQGNKIVVDNNSVYLTGYFSDSVDFDPGAGTFNISSFGGSSDVFITKLNYSGDLVWVRRIGEFDDDSGNSLDVDGNGNVYTIGSIEGGGPVDLDPGVGTFYLTPIAGNEDIFILKLNANGDFLWAKQLGGSGNDRATSIDIDNNGEIYTTGFFVGTADFDPGSSSYNFVSNGGNDIFISKLSALGDFIWARQIGGVGSDIVYEIVVNNLGGVHIAGYFQSSVDFDPGSAIFTLNGDLDAYVLKLQECLSTFSTQFYNACSPYTWNGTTYNSSGTYNYVTTNAAGCDSTATLDLVIGDITAPLANVASLPNVTGQCSVTSLTAPTATDNCAGIITGTHNASLPITSQGTTVVTWTFDDGNGNTSTQTQNVVIDDVTAPVANVASLSNVTAECSVTALTAPTATDNCSGAITGTHNVTLPITTQGTTVVTWTYNDGNGNTSTQTQNVVIEDVTAPVANVASLSNITSECSVTSLTAPTAADNCAGTITATHNVTLPITSQGTTVVTWTYDDGNGNTSTQTQNIVIDDVTVPLANVASLSNITSECSVTSLTAPTASDNCAGTITATHNVTLPITTQGTTVVTWTYDDGNGNTSTQTQDVVITPIDNGITQIDAITLSANSSGYSYQWVDCNNGNAPVSGATNQSFTPATAGSYACLIDNGTCSVMTDCLSSSLSIYEFAQDNILSVFPNPSNGSVTISSESTFSKVLIIDLMGKVIDEFQYSATSHTTLQLPEASGTYIVQVHFKNTMLITKILKN